MESTQVFKILMISSFIGAPPEKVVAKAKVHYKKLAAIYHPDKGGDEEMFKLLANAWSALCSPEGLDFLQQEYVTGLNLITDARREAEVIRKQREKEKEEHRKFAQISYTFKYIHRYLLGQNPRYPFSLKMLLYSYDFDGLADEVKACLRALLKGGYIERLQPGVYLRLPKSLHKLSLAQLLYRNQ